MDKDENKAEEIYRNINDITEENIRLVKYALNSKKKIFLASLVNKIYYIVYQKMKYTLLSKNGNKNERYNHGRIVQILVTQIPENTDLCKKLLLVNGLYSKRVKADYWAGLSDGECLTLSIETIKKDFELVLEVGKLLDQEVANG